MQQPGGQTWNGGHQFQMGGGHHWPPAGDGPDSTAHSLWRKFPREFQRTRAMPKKLSEEGQDFINNLIGLVLT